MVAERRKDPMLLKSRVTAYRPFIFCLIFLTASIAQVARQMPKIEGESLASHRVVLPDEAAGKVTILIFGFTKASKTPTSAWASKLLAHFGTQPDYCLYQLPVLEDVPRLLRGVVISGIKKGVPENQRGHFVPILQEEAELKKFVQYSEPEDAYLVILSRTGTVIEQSHGAPSEANYSRVQHKIEAALNQ